MKFFVGAWAYRKGSLIFLCLDLYKDGMIVNNIEHPIPVGRIIEADTNNSVKFCLHDALAKGMAAMHEISSDVDELTKDSLIIDLHTWVKPLMGVYYPVEVFEKPAKSQAATDILKCSSCGRTETNPAKLGAECKANLGGGSICHGVFRKPRGAG